MLCCVAICFNLLSELYNIVDATVQKRLLKALNNTGQTFFSWSRLSFRACIRECSSVVLVFDCKSRTKDDKFKRFFVNFYSDLTFQIASLFAKPQDSHPVGYV